MGFDPKMNAFLILIPYLIITMLGKEMFIDEPGRMCPGDTSLHGLILERQSFHMV